MAIPICFEIEQTQFKSARTRRQTVKDVIPSKLQLLTEHIHEPVTNENLRNNFEIFQAHAPNNPLVVNKRDLPFFNLNKLVHVARESGSQSPIKQFRPLE